MWGYIIRESTHFPSFSHLLDSWESDHKKWAGFAASLPILNRVSRQLQQRPGRLAGVEVDVCVDQVFYDIFTHFFGQYSFGYIANFRNWVRILFVYLCFVLFIDYLLLNFKAIPLTVVGTVNCTSTEVSLNFSISATSRRDREGFVGSLV